MELKSYQKLIVWHKSMELVFLVYEKTKSFPKEELFGLTSQMRRSVVSIPANIAEGYAREGQKEFTLFLGYSRGSGAELETYLPVARRLKYISETDFQKMYALHAEIARILFALQQKLKSKK
jgi:four helix bundle protein